MSIINFWRPSIRSNLLKIYFPDTVGYNGGACKRILTSIGFIAGKTSDEGRASERQKMKKMKKIENIDLIIFFRSVGSKIVF